MKVLITRLSPPDTVGGAELSARDITRAFQQLGHQPTLLTNLQNPVTTKGINRHGTAPNPLKVSGALNALTYAPHMLAQFMFYYRTTKKIDPDIIHPHSRHDQLLLTAVGKILKKPVIWRDPGDLVPQLSMRLRNPLQKFNRQLQLWSLRNATHVIVLNNEDRKAIQELTGLDHQKMTVIGSDIMFEDYTVKPQQDHSKTTYGVISRLDQHKGVQYAIQAFKQLSAPNTRLLIAGDGEYRSELERLANSDQNITFLGKIEDQSVFYNQIDFLIQPSEFEGWGRTVKEAMLFNAPVIGSDTGGIAEQIADGENGLLFPVGDVDQLTKSMQRVGDEAITRKLVSGGKQTIDQTGDWVKKVKEQYIPLFERFIHCG